MPSGAPSPETAGTPSYDVFLSYHRADREVTLQLRHWLETQGVRTFMDAELAVGLPWVKLLEGALQQSRAVAVLIGPSGFGNWQLREIWWALDRQTKESTVPFPVIPVLLPGSRPPDNAGFLPLNTWIDLRNGLVSDDQLTVLAKAVRSGELSLVTSPQECPYRGLLPFTEGDSPFFCGRQEQTEQLFQAMRARNLVAVVAPSGSGKSSLVQAGLVPVLRRQKPPETTWEIAIAKPGDRPWRRLADALMPLLEPDSPLAIRLERAGSIEKALGSGGFPECIDRALDASGGADRLLVVLDQFEELFTLTAPAARGPFLDEMLRCVKAARLTLILVVRGDFYGRAIASHRELSDALESRVINLSPMRSEELREAIQKPALRIGLSFEAGLVDEILDDVASEPGNLPLLQFALTQLWNERRGVLLSHEGYLKNGKLRGAIANRAERIWSGLDPGEQDTVRRLFTRLVRLARPEENSGDTRQRVRSSELSGPEWDIAQKLANERLLVTDRVGPEETVEVAHEALIRHWDRLRSWLDSDREFFLWRQRLDATIAQWKANAQDEASLLRGRALEEAEHWRATRRELLSAVEESCIEASSAVRERERRETLVRRRNVARLRTLVAMLPLLAAGLAVAALVALRQTAVATSRELAASAKLYLDARNTDRSVPAFLALQAVRAATTREAREALHQAVQTVGKPAIEGAGGGVNAIAFAAAGKLFGAGWEDGTVQLRSGESFELVRPGFNHPARVVSLAFTPDSSGLATAGGQMAKLWDLASGRERGSFPHQCADVMAVVFVLGGSRMVTGCNDGLLTIWDPHDGKALYLVSTGTQIRGMAADPKAERFATAMGDGTVRLWDSAQAREIRTFRGAQDEVEAVAFRPDGRQVAAGVKDGAAVVWDVESGRPLLVLRAGPTALASIAYSPDGRYLLAGNLAGRGIVWDAATGQPVITLEGPPEQASSVVAAAFDPSAQAAEPRVALASAAGVRVFDFDLGRLQQRARALLTRPFTTTDCQQYLGKKDCVLNP